jgi:hypothetical protein
MIHTALALAVLLAPSLDGTRRILARPSASPSGVPGSVQRASGLPPLQGAGYRALDAGEFAALRAGVPAASITIDLPTRGAVTVNLAAMPLVDEDFRLETAAVVKGEVRRAPFDAPLPFAYAGTVQGEPDSRVYLGFGRGDGAHLTVGSIEIGTDSWWISDGGLRARARGLPPMIAHESALAAQSVEGLACAAAELAENARHEGSGAGEGGIAGGAACREFRIAVDTDTEFTMSAQGGNTVAAAQYALLLMGASSQVYARDVDVRIPITFLRLWTGEDPWTMTGMVDQLYQYRDYWAANESAIARDLGHHLAGRGLGGGVAWLSVACSNQDYGFGLSSGVGYGFPYPLIDHDHGNWEPMVVSHELGHNFGAPHTHDHNPQADGCGTNDCSQAWSGTIMSYCHGCPGGMSNVSLLFHPYSIASMSAHIAGTPCVDQGAFAVNDAIATIENTPAAIDVLLNDGYVNCASASILSFSPTSAEGGAIALVAGSAGANSQLRYTPPANFDGADTFGYTIVDANGATSSATVHVQVQAVLQQSYVLGAAAGVRAHWYALAGDTSALPDFSTLTRYGTAILPNIEIPSTGGNFSLSGRADLVAARFEGWLDVPQTGVWNLSTESDDGSRLFVDGQLVVLNDGLHGMVDRTGSVALEAGLHPVVVEFFENYGGAGEIVRWEGPGTARAIIPASAWTTGGSTMAIDLDGDGTVGAADLALMLASWGPAPAGTPADFDRNGSVNAADLARLLERWGS